VALADQLTLPDPPMTFLRGQSMARPVGEPNPLTAGFFKACEEMGHRVVEDVCAPVRDGAGMWISIPRIAAHMR
jgi:hypothetical protein